MAVSEFEDIRSDSFPIRRFHHTIKPEVKKIGSIKNPNTDAGNLIVVTGSTEEFMNGQSESEHYDMLHMENVRDFDSIDEKWRAAEGKFKSMGNFMTFLTFAFSTVIMWCIFDMLSDDLVVIVCCYLALGLILKFSPPQSIISTRAIKWTLDEFSEEIKGYFFTSPTIYDKSGSWRLVLRQVSDEEANFGLIVTEIDETNAYVVEARVEISTRIIGRNTPTEMNDVIKFVHTFEREGGCGYSKAICLSFEELKNHKLEIKCRIQLKKKRSIYENMGKRFLNKIMLAIHTTRICNKDLKYPAVKFPENGIILSETKYQSKMLAGPLPVILTGTELEGDALSFMKHPETKVFVWKIPNFSKHLKNVEYWEIFSPKLLVGSHGFCSIWRLQLAELEGIFRIDMELRGLPRGISKIKMRYLMELMDNSGEFIAPNNCGSTIKYPEYLHLSEPSICVHLFRQDGMLERFMDKDDTLNLRISLQCEPTDSLIFGRPFENANKMFQNYLHSVS